MSNGPHFQHLEQVEDLRKCMTDLINANQRLQRRVDGLEKANRTFKDSLDSDRAEADAVVTQFTAELGAHHQANQLRGEVQPPGFAEVNAQDPVSEIGPE